MHDVQRDIATLSKQNNSNAVEIQSVDVFYRLYSKRVHSLKELLISGFKDRSQYSVHHALKNFSLSIKRGEALGITGANGAGKSTLLKLITRVITPAKGNVNVNGRMSALIELGAGFVPELTGRENLYFGGSILGFTRKQISELIGSIVEFSGVGEFLDEPLRSYSSGMQARLGFSLAIAVKPDILIVDEVLAVGDSAFQKKCKDWMLQFMDSGGTLLFVSHDQQLVDHLCTRQIHIERGEIVRDVRTTPAGRKGPSL